MATEFGEMLALDVEKRAPAIAQALDDIPEDRLFERIVPTMNPAGNLVLHVSGNLMTYVVKGVGGRDYLRDRPREFSATGLPRTELAATFATAIDASLEVLRGTDEAAFAAPYDGPEFPGASRARIAFHSVEHLGYHAGQLVLLSKLLAPTL